MAYNQELARTVKALLENKPGFEEKKMFGGIGFLLHGNMACGILNTDLIVRVGPDNYADALNKPDTRPFDITGRPMKGWVMVSCEGNAITKIIGSWVAQGAAFALTLPAK